MAPIIGKVREAANSLVAYTTGLRHLLHKPYTLKFPQQRYAVEKGYRGRHLLHLDRCTGCGICAWICPEKCITIVQRGDRWFAEYTRDRLVWSPERLAKPPVKKDDKYVFSVEGRRGASQVSEQEH